MPALVPIASGSTLMPSEASSSDATGQMLNTPIEAVMGGGWATMTSPRMAAREPPDAATSPIQAITRLPPAPVPPTGAATATGGGAGPPGETLPPTYGP